MTRPKDNPPQAAESGGAPVAPGAAPAQAPLARRFMRSLWREWVRPIAPVVIVLLTIRSSLADWNDVPTGSMKPTILEGDRIFVNKSAFDLRVPFSSLINYWISGTADAGWSICRTGEPRHGDIIVFFSPENGIRMVKRVIALPGDHIELVRNRLYVNGVMAEYEPVDLLATPGGTVGHGVFNETFDGNTHTIMLAPTGSGRSTWPPPDDKELGIVPDDHVFVMGDNRDNSKDSRWFGFVPRDAIVGRAVGVIVSLDLEQSYKPRWDRFFKGLD